MAEYDYDKAKVEIPLPYARALVQAAEALKALYDGSEDVYGNSYSPSRLTFWDGSSAEQSEWFIDVHDDEIWISLAERKPLIAPPF